MEFLIMSDFFFIFLLEMEIYYEDRFQKLSLLIGFFSFLTIEKYIFEKNFLIR